MSCRFALSASVAAVVITCNPLHAGPLRLIQAQKVDLATLAGVAYGDRLVLALRAPQSDTPFPVRGDFRGRRDGDALRPAQSRRTGGRQIHALTRRRILRRAATQAVFGSP
jgi:hypothetical protein